MLRAQQGSPVSTLGSKYILYSYMDALGVGCTDMRRFLGQKRPRDLGTEGLGFKCWVWGLQLTVHSLGFSTLFKGLEVGVQCLGVPTPKTLNPKS